MVKLKVRLLDSGKDATRIGSEKEVEHYLRSTFPRETEHALRLLDCVKAINDEGFAEVDIEPYKPAPDSNLLPANYDAQEPAEDPWRREGDR